MATSLLALPGAASFAAAAASLFDGPQWWGLVVLLGWLVWLALQGEGQAVACMLLACRGPGKG